MKANSARPTWRKTLPARSVHSATNGTDVQRTHGRLRRPEHRQRIQGRDTHSIYTGERSLMVRQVFPTLQDTTPSPLGQQIFKPRSTADAMNPLMALHIAPPGPTMFPEPYPAAEQAGPTVARAALADAPLPPSRPSGLGGLLSSAVAPAAAPAAAAPAAQPQSSMFTSIDRQNSGPNDRFRGGGTALNLSGLLGGLFGGGGPAPQPTPPPPLAPSAGPRGPARPDMSGIAFDAEGNPSYDGLGAGILSAPGLQPQDPTQLAGTVAKPNWWKPLR